MRAWGPSRLRIGALALGLTALLYACGGASVKTRSQAPVWTGSDSLRVAGIMEFLASDALKGRDTGSPGLDSAAAFLENQLRTFGFRPYFSTFKDTLSNSKDLAYNIVGYLPGADPVLKNQVVLLGAHYDHIGIVPLQQGDGIANGANDNASGTTTVVELARYLGSRPAPARTVVVAFFSAEERGLLGSKHLAARMKSMGVPLYAVLNFEMTGVPMAGKSYATYLTGFDKSNLAEVSNRYAGDNLVGYLPQASEYNLFQRSDNYPFFREFGIPAHTYSTFDFTNYAFYHQPGDEADQMDFGHMARLVNRLTPVVEGIVNGPEGELKTQ